MFVVVLVSETVSGHKQTRTVILSVEAYFPEVTKNKKKKVPGPV